MTILNIMIILTILNNLLNIFNIFNILNIFNKLFNFKKKKIEIIINRKLIYNNIYNENYIDRI